MRDLQFALRLLVRSRGTTTAAVICLALGIGATTAIFSIVNSVILRPLGYREPAGLVRLYTEFPGFPGGGLRRFATSPPEFLDLRRDLKSWSHLEAWVSTGTNLGGGSEPVRVSTAYVSGGMFEMLGVSPAKGRTLSQQDDRPDAPQTAIISHGLWLRAFGGDPAIVSKEVRIDGQVASIVGVMPPGFQFPPGETDSPELWSSLQIDPAKPGPRSRHYLSILGRLKPDVPLTRARQEIDQMVSSTGENASEGNHLFHPKNHPVVSYALHDEVTGGIRNALYALLGAVGFVLLIACGNVANLLLARAEGRQREIAIRTAMGADAGALLRQFLLEGLLLSLIGAALGLVLAFGGLRLITTFGAGRIPRAAEITIDPTVLAFTLGLSMLTGVFFGLAPLLHRFSRTIGESLKAAGGRTTASLEANRFRRAMVVGELGLALMLLIGAGLMVRTFWKLQSVDIGMQTHNIVTMRIALPQAAYPNAQRVMQFWQQLLERTNRLPGVVSATRITGLPPVRALNANDTQIEGWVRRPDGPLQNIDYYNVVGDRFLETTGARLIEGRMFDERDGETTPAVVVINQTMARAHWPNQSPLGKRVRPGFTDPWRTIVGVIADVKNAGIDKPAGTELYLPFRQAGNFRGRDAILAVRTHGHPLDIVSAVRREIAALEPGIPVSQIRDMDEVVGLAQARPRFLALLLAMFSAVALTLAALGIYGVMSYAVAQRTSEFGVRMAIGAQQKDVLSMMLGEGLWLGLAGVLVGAVGAAAITRYVSGLLYGVNPLDPATFLVTASGLTVIILLACYIPARRATKVDPMTALRYE